MPVTDDQRADGRLRGTRPRRIALVQGDAGTHEQMLEKLTGTSPRFGAAFGCSADVYASLNRREDAEAGRSASRIGYPPNDPYVDPTLDVLVRESRSSTFLLQQASTADLDTNAAWREYLVRRAVELDPENVDALADLATMLRVLHRYDEALDVLERERRLVGEDPPVLAESRPLPDRPAAVPRGRAGSPPRARGLDDANAHYLLRGRDGSAGTAAERRWPNTSGARAESDAPDALNDLGYRWRGRERSRRPQTCSERLVATDPTTPTPTPTSARSTWRREHNASHAEREFRAGAGDQPGPRAGAQGMQKLGR